MNVSEKLILATKELIKEVEDLSSITARKIVERAGVNLSMINYCFKSKDELMYLSVEEILKETATQWTSKVYLDVPPYEKLREIILAMSEATKENIQIKKISVKYEFNKVDIILPQYIMPIVKELLGKSASELEVRITALNIISFIQTLLIRQEAFLRYSGRDMLKQDERVEVIDAFLSSYFRKSID